MGVASDAAACPLGAGAVVAGTPSGLKPREPRKASIRWDNADGIAHCYRAQTLAWESVAPPPDFERNTLFLDELTHFLACVTGEATPACTFEDGLRALEIALVAKQSAALQQALAL